MKISWIAPEDLLEYEFRQAELDGNNISAAREAWAAAKQNPSGPGDLRSLAQELLDKIEAQPFPESLAQREPLALETIRLLRPAAARISPSLPLNQVELHERILGGWLGRAAGCLLGKPVEKTSRAGIKEILQSVGRWPLADYFSAHGMSPELVAKYPWNRHSGAESLKENLVCMTEDDDMNYAMLNLRVLETAGLTFDTGDVAIAWLENMPALSAFTAERVAYLNLLSYLEPPATATRRNPYREWIGAQIRADVWGWVSPGNPALAAELAWRDARLSHVRNGIYGEMFVAAMIAAAAGTTDVESIIAAGLAEIPADCRLAHAVRDAMRLPAQESSWEGVLDRLHQRFGNYHWVHVINNAALVVAALAYGRGDYERTICAVVMGGWDTDSNGATAGSVVGTMLGARQLPAKWIGPLNNRIRSSLKGFDNAAFDDLARRTAAQIVDRA